MGGALGGSRCGRRFQEEGIITPRFSEDDAGNVLAPRISPVLTPGIDSHFSRTFIVFASVEVTSFLYRLRLVRSRAAFREFSSTN